MFLTPGPFTRRADFFHQLAQLTAAGAGLVGALRQLHRFPPSRDYRAPLAAVLADLDSGRAFSEALARRGGWLTDFELALIQAGERSGRLDAALRSLARHHQERAGLARRLRADLVYPALLLHAAVFLLPAPALAGAGGPAAYLAQVLAVLVPVHGLTAAAVVVSRSGRGPAFRSAMERGLGLFPLVGSGRRHLALGRCADALEALVSAGIGVVEAWPLAAAASGSPALAREVAAWRSPLAAGQTPAELLQRSREFPEVFANLYQTGEATGSLDDALRRLGGFHGAEGTRELRAAAQWFPRLLYGVIAAWIAWRALSFWSGYFERIQEVL